MAAHRLERRAGGIGLDLVVAGGHPDFAAVLQANLRRPEYMTGRVKAQTNTVMLEGFAVGQCLQRHIGADACPQDALAVLAGQVVPHAPARMVAVSMGDDGAFDRAPGVDVEITGRAVQAFGAGDDKIHGRRCVAGLLVWNPARPREFAGRAGGVV